MSRAGSEGYVKWDAETLDTVRQALMEPTEQERLQKAQASLRGSRNPTVAAQAVKLKTTSQLNAAMAKLSPQDRV
jgi:hypothetical protein